MMDDFGSGYSSLNTLKDITFDVLKIDMKFVDYCNTNGRGKIIVSSVVKMAQELGMSIIVEGVETIEQSDVMKDLGCDYIQGYYYARPMQMSEYERILSNPKFQGRDA